MKQQTMKIKHFTSGELRCLIVEDEGFCRAISLFACYQVSIGKRAEDVASFYGTSPEVVTNWVRQLNEGGIEGLTGNEKPAMFKVRGEDKQLSFLEIVKYRRPVDYGFNNNSWNPMHLVKLTLHEFQFSYRLTQLCHFFWKPRPPKKTN